ncbi:MAG: TlpA family protein disulfide reductase [Candidatus Eremiobacteraeota bacterium]|nr:TlpA family protein disulfide reductase [Candidatus Eremiobacteraeota bacterium]
MSYKNGRFKAMRDYKIIFFVIIIISLLVMFSSASHAQLHEEEKETLDFKLSTSSGETISLSDCRGEVVVVVFWAFWCDTWKTVVEGYEYLASDMGKVPFRFFAVAIDAGMPEVVLLEKKDGKLPFPVLVDKNGKISDKYNIKIVPTVFVMDKSGKIVYRHEGYPGNRKLKELIWKLNQQDMKN